MVKNTAKYAWSFSRNSSFLRGLFYYAAPCRTVHKLKLCCTIQLALIIFVIFAADYYQRSVG